MIGSGEAILCACPAVTTFPSSKWAVIIVLPFLLDLSEVESNCLAKLSLKCIKNTGIVKETLLDYDLNIVIKSNKDNLLKSF